MQSDKTKLEMLDGIIVRDLEELRQNFDLDKVIECFKNGMLSSWLGDRYYEEEVENLSNISFGDNDFIEKLCMILGVEYNAHNPSDIKSTRMSKLYQYTNDEKIISTIAVNTIVKNKTGEVSSCDILYTDNLEKFNADYLEYTIWVAENCQDRDLSDNSMVIGTSAIVDTEIDGAVGMNSGIFNNPFIIWGMSLD